MNRLTEAQVALVTTTRERIAKELLFWIPRDEASMIREMSRDELVVLHHSLGRHIRNEFELWLPEHEVTAIWHTNQPSVDADVDDHPCHPDNFSFSVIERLWELYQERKVESL